MVNSSHELESTFSIREEFLNPLPFPIAFTLTFKINLILINYNNKI